MSRLLNMFITESDDLSQKEELIESLETLILMVENEILFEDEMEDLELTIKSIANRDEILSEKKVKKDGKYRKWLKAQAKLRKKYRAKIKACKKKGSRYNFSLVTQECHKASGPKRKRRRH